ncbi:MAG: hypothetical protein FWB96_01485 [Defluviitaleaceae bacterium]|nr:hypothetical protein [Defluviitaleaceae bacterium]MCL2261634.1 hypothetical protein [Defluviitaleaceae bacterium]
MAILQSRKPGSPTVAMTVRIDADAHKALRQYALSGEKTMSLSLDEIIFKATNGTISRDEKGCADDGGRQ